MGLGDFWLQFNNGKKQQLNDAKHGVRKEQVDSKFHNLFDIYDDNGDGTLEKNELEGIFKGIKKFAGADKILNSSENIQARSIFAQQANIEDADFQGFVQSISTASEDIVSSSEKPTPDGGKEITTEYKDGSIETISYYPDGSYKFKKFDHKYTQTTSYYTIADEPDKQISPKALEVRIRNAYNKKVQEIKNANRSSDIESRRAIYLSIPDYKQFREEYKMAHNICMHSSTNEYERHDLELSDRAKFDVEVRKFLIEHYVATHQGAKEALDTMGILDDIGAAINAGAGELWNSIVNVYNKWFGDGTQEDYQNFYELVNKFNPHYDKSLMAKHDLEFMTNHPDAFFGDFETDIVKNTGHKFELEKTLQFQHLTEQYQTATIYKQRIYLLKKALSEVDMYWAEQTALTNNPVQSEGLNPYTHIVSANNYLLAFFGNDQEAADMVLNGTIGNPDATMTKIKELMQDALDALENALLKRTTTLESDGTGSMMMNIATEGMEQYSYDELQAKYQSAYKEMYGVDFVPDELTEKVMGAKATGGMVKLAAITIISIIITRSPIMAEISGAAGGAAIEGASANLIRTLVTKYGQTAVQQGIKFAMTTGTLATDVGLTLLNQVTSERGVNSQELWESAKGSAKYIYFGAYIGAPIAQAVAQRIGQIGMTGRLLEGGTKATQGAIQTTTISGEKLLQNMMKGSSSLLAKGGAFATDVGLFTGLEIATEGANPLDAFSEQGEMLGKLKIMNGFIEYMLGAKTHTALDKARWDIALDKSGVKNWNIKEIQQPSGKGNKTIYTVDIDGIPIGRFEDLNVLATAIMERVSAVYSTTPAPSQGAKEKGNEIELQEPKLSNKQKQSLEAELESLGIKDLKTRKMLIDFMEKSVNWITSDVQESITNAQLNFLLKKGATTENTYLLAPQPNGTASIKSYTNAARDLIEISQNVDSQLKIKCDNVRVEYNGLDKLFLDKETGQKFIVITDDCSISGASILEDTLTKLNPGNNLREGQNVEIVFAPTVLGVDAKITIDNFIDCYNSITKEELLDLKKNAKKYIQNGIPDNLSLNERNLLSIILTITDGHKTGDPQQKIISNLYNSKAGKGGKITFAIADVSETNPSQLAKDYRQTDAYQNLTTTEQAEIDSWYTANGNSFGYHDCATSVVIEGYKGKGFDFDGNITKTDVQVQHDARRALGIQKDGTNHNLPARGNAPNNNTILPQIFAKCVGVDVSRIKVSGLTDDKTYYQLISNKLTTIINERWDGTSAKGNTLMMSYKIKKGGLYDGKLTIGKYEFDAGSTIEIFAKDGTKLLSKTLPSIPEGTPMQEAIAKIREAIAPNNIEFEKATVVYGKMKINDKYDGPLEFFKGETETFVFAVPENCSQDITVKVNGVTIISP